MDDKFLKDVEQFLHEFTLNAECGFLDEIPGFKPDCYYHPLVKEAYLLLLNPNSVDERNY